MTGTVTATHANVTGLPTSIENVGHKLCVDNFSPLLSDQINHKGVAWDFGKKLYQNEVT